MDDFTPFLQIIHISDLHVGADPRSIFQRLRGEWRKYKKIFPERFLRRVDEGLATHDNQAADLFLEFLQTLSQDAAWSHCPTWLVDTGDVTTFGDQASMTLGTQVLQDFARECQASACIYGNHDAWPSKFPVLASDSELAWQKRVLKRHYSIETPMLALRANIPSGGTVLFYIVDSVIHNRFTNSLALGQITDEQLSALSELIDRNLMEDQPQFRILAVHHPVHFPPPRPSFQMSLRNDHRVAKVLYGPSEEGARPLVHLVLSGHTHSLYPQHGSLPSEPSQCKHPHLGDEQCQFVVGTLMQRDNHNSRLGWPHQCEILRLYYSPTNQGVLVMERLLAARPTGSNYYAVALGPYRFVANQDSVAEEITFKV